MNETRYKVLVDLVQAAALDDADASRSLSDAIKRFQNARSALTAYETALQAYLRGTDLSYTPPQRVNPLDELIRQTVENTPEIQSAAPLSPPKVTKQGIILEALANSNGKGLRVREILAAIPNNAPLEIRIEDLYRALPRLLNARKIWRDERGRYYFGGSPKNINEVSSSSGEDYRPLINETVGSKNK